MLIQLEKKKKKEIILMQLGKALEHLKFKILIIIINLINQYAGTHLRPWIKNLGSNSYFSIDFQNVYQVFLTFSY